MRNSVALISLLASILPLITTSAAQDLQFHSGPVIDTNFQDPSLIHLADGTWYAFACANGNPPHINVQLATSSDFSNWDLKHGYDALPKLGSWAAKVGHLWSPDINQLPDGSFIIYYSANVVGHPKKHCIGAALSKTIHGPYTALNETLACNLAKGGAIDADGFVDTNGDLYVVYKVDGNSIGHGGPCKNLNAPIVPTPIMLQKVSSEDGYTKIGEPVELLQNIPADGPNIEAPALMFSVETGMYFLFYNAGCFKSFKYRIEYATSMSLTGPYMRNPKPLLVTGSTAAHVHSPGGIDFNANGTRVVFQGDLNLLWAEKGHGNRDRGMYAASIMMNENNAKIIELY